MELQLIVAMTENRVIGKSGCIPWNIKEDNSLFEELTIGSNVIMGRHTYQYIPEKLGPIRGRSNFVVSRKKEHLKSAKVYSSIEKAIHFADMNKKKIFIIGGMMLFKAALPLISKFHISHIKKKLRRGCIFS